MSEIALTIRMLSDWHIGTGAGDPPMIDRGVIRDADGLPIHSGGHDQGYLERFSRGAYCRHAGA